jgi:hypothetical protein
MEKGNISEAENLRQNAEEIKYKKSLKTTSIHSEETLELIYQLRETQSELKLQNNKLNLALSNAADAIKLYDLTPAGNFTLSKEGEIIRLNICGSQMLSKKCSDLINSRFGFFVSDDTRPIFNLFIGKVFDSKGKESCEVTLSTDDNLQMYVLLIGIASENGKQCLVNMVDITERKQLELELAMQIKEKAKRAAELIIANKELAYQNEEKAKRVAELVIANEEKTKRAAELILANKEKAKRVAEFIIANEEKAKRAAELILAKKELAYQMVS